MATIKSRVTEAKATSRRVNSGDRGTPISGLFAVAERSHPGIEEEVGLSSAALRAGELVRSMRKSNGWTQTALADVLGWDQVRISNIERGEGTRGPTFDVLTKIADACGYDVQFAPRATEIMAHLAAAAAATAKPASFAQVADVALTSPRRGSQRLVSPDDDDDFEPPTSAL